MNIDKDILMLECRFCGRKFHKEQHLNTHLNLHDKNRPFECKICMKRFDVLWHLKRHLLTHNNVKPFSCKSCNRSFCTSCELNNHVNFSHKGIREYRCEICNKSFTLKSNLKVHLRKHTGEQPYKCKICHKAFYQSGHLSYHLKKHQTDNVLHASSNIPDKTIEQNVDQNLYYPTFKKPDGAIPQQNTHTTITTTLQNYYLENYMRINGARGFSLLPTILPGYMVSGFNGRFVRSMNFNPYLFHPYYRNLAMYQTIGNYNKMLYKNSEVKPILKSAIWNHNQNYLNASSHVQQNQNNQGHVWRPF